MRMTEVAGHLHVVAGRDSQVAVFSLSLEDASLATKATWDRSRSIRRGDIVVLSAGLVAMLGEEGGEGPAVVAADLRKTTVTFETLPLPRILEEHFDLVSGQVQWCTCRVRVYKVIMFECMQWCCAEALRAVNS